MIKIKTNTVLVDFDSKPLSRNVEGKQKDLTIGEAISTVLAGQSSNPTLAWQFGKKFATEKEVELKAEDVVFLKKELSDSKAWTAIVVGQIIEMLDTPSTK